MANRPTNAIFTVNSVTWTPYAEQIQMQRNREEIETPTHEDPEAILLADDGATFTVSGPWSMTFDGYGGVLFEDPDTDRTVIYSPLGNTATYPRYTATDCRPISYKISCPAKGVVKLDYSLRSRAGITRTTY